MKVVVLGATGNFGTSVLDALARDPSVDEIVGVARRTPDRTWPRTRCVARDLRTDDLVDLLTGADAVVHLAWMFQPTHAPDVTWGNNAVGTARVLDAVERAEVPTVVCASSIGAYSPAPGCTVDEGWPTHSRPGSGYGREKAYVERLLDGFEARHPDRRVVRLRPAFLFKRASASEQWRIFAGRLLPRPGRRIPALPFPAGLRFPALHTDDAAAACRLALHRPVRGAFNLAAAPTLDGPTLAEILDARLVPVAPGVVRTAIALGWHLGVVPVEPGLFDLLSTAPLLDTGRARAELGWTPEHSATDAVRELLDGLAEGAGAPTAPLAGAG